MSRMAGCANFNGLCAPGSLVPACKTFPGYPLLPTTKAANDAVRARARACVNKGLGHASRCGGAPDTPPPPPPCAPARRVAGRLREHASSLTTATVRTAHPPARACPRPARQVKALCTAKPSRPGCSECLPSFNANKKWGQCNLLAAWADTCVAEPSERRGRAVAARQL